MTHTPAGDSRGSVLICPGVLHDLMKNYRSEVILSRALAARGMSVQRFQYRGKGNSDGTVGILSFETMCEDLRTAAEHLESVTGHAPSTIVAARMGALVGSASSGDFGAPMLVLFEPVLSAERYYRDGFRARMVSTVTEEGKDRLSARAMLAELNENGLVDMVGFSLTRALYESTVDLTLSATIQSHTGKTLIVQLSKESASPLVRFVEEQKEEGRWVETLALDVGEAWWFIEDGRVPEVQRSAREEATRSVADWIVSNLEVVQ